MAIANKPYEVHVDESKISIDKVKNELRDKLVSDKFKEEIDSMTINSLFYKTLLEKEELQQRIDKTIKYIKCRCTEFGELVHYGDSLNTHDLINILKGSDKQ